MGFFEKIDQKILDGLYQRVSDWFEKYFNISNFLLAYACYGILLADALYIEYWIYPVVNNRLSLLFAPTVIVSVGRSLYLMDKEQDRLKKKSLRLERTYNSLRPYESVRLISICAAFSLTALDVILMHRSPAALRMDSLLFIFYLQIFLICMGSAGYFAACTPKQPKSKPMAIPTAMTKRP